MEDSPKQSVESKEHLLEGPEDFPKSVELKECID